MGFGPTLATVTLVNKKGEILLKLKTILTTFAVISSTAVMAAADISVNERSSYYDDYPFYANHKVSLESDDNQLQILHSGIASLQKRIDLIRKAKKRISIEYFIWEKDTAGLLMFHELIKRAKEGIDVRIIVDKSMTIIEMDEFYAEAVAKYGIDLRHYHRALDPSSAQFRTHRKILVIDDNEAITGGRNIGDDYFDMDEEYNFVDRDVYVKGTIAKAIQDSFDAYWADDIVKEAKVLNTNPSSNRLFRNRRDRQRYQRQRQEALDKKRQEAAEWIESHEEMNSVAERVESIARPILNSYPQMVCPDLSFSSDRPGANFLERIKDDYKDEFRITRKVLFDHIHHDTKVGEDYIMASPYFILNEQWQKSLSYVIGKKGVDASIYTNSLGSTDAFYIAALFYDRIFNWEEFGLRPFIHNSKYDSYYKVYNEMVEKARWGMHDKTQVFNDESFFIGTYNIDNRSDFYNSEMGVYCSGSPELTQILKDDMHQRMGSGYEIVGGKKAVDSTGADVDVYGNATEKQIKVMKTFTLPAKLFKPLM